MKAILIDDEQLALDFLENQLHKIDDVKIIGKYTNPVAVLEQVKKRDFDVAFIDINMPEMNGLELAEHMMNEKQAIIIVFVTAYDEYAVSAFELNALDYLVKPIQINRLKQTVDRVKDKLMEQSRVDQSTPKQLYITLCKQLLIGHTRKNLQTVSWRTAKVEELFLYLLQNQGNLVRKDFLAELLWPDLTPDRSFAQLYTAIYHVRSKLRDFGSHLAIKSSMEGYILELTNVIVDIHEWERRISTLPPLHSNSSTMYEEVMELNTGPFLAEYDYLWAEPIREKYEQQWLRVLFKLAEYYFQENILDRAISWYYKISKSHDTIEEAHFSLMKIYAMQNEHSLVKQQFANLKKILAKELDILPSKNIITWYENWTQQTDYY